MSALTVSDGSAEIKNKDEPLLLPDSLSCVWKELSGVPPLLFRYPASWELPPVQLRGHSTAAQCCFGKSFQTLASCLKYAENRTVHILWGFVVVLFVQTLVSLLQNYCKILNDRLS